MKIRKMETSVLTIKGQMCTGPYREEGRVYVCCLTVKDALNTKSLLKSVLQWLPYQ